MTRADLAIFSSATGESSCWCGIARAIGLAVSRRLARSTTNAANLVTLAKQDEKSAAIT
jgi:hypothetical protein